jgi:hypothetical protein
LYLGAIPVAGGKYREGVAGTIANLKWSNANATVNANLKYNAIAVMGVEPKPGVKNKSPQNIGSVWVKDK